MKNATESQNTQIINALIKGKRITPIDALEKYGCFRLSGRIHDLKRVGWDIKSETILTKNGKRVAQYYLEKKKL